MPASDALFLLLSSLTPTEKRYLSVYATRHVRGEQNGYAWLLKAILAQENYDEAILKQQWSLQGFALQQFAYIKNYLYNLILQAMRDYHRKEHPRREIEDLLSDAEFLIKRNLHDQATKLITKARQMALRYEFPALVLTADGLARTLTLRQTLPNVDETLRSLTNSSRAALALLSELTSLQMINTQAIANSRKSFTIRTQEIGTANPADELLIEKSLGSAGFWPRFLALRIVGLRALMAGKKTLLWESYHLQLAHWQAHSDMKTAYQQPYLLTLVNYIASCQVMSKWEEMAGALTQLELMQPQSPLEKVEIIQNYAYYKMLLAINTRDWEELLPSVERISDVAQTHANHLPKARLIAIQYNVAIAYFFLDLPKQALTALNTILNDAHSQHREDLQQAARLLQAVMHYELGNHDLLDYVLRNLKRHLQVKHALHAFEASLVKALRDLLARPADRSRILQQLKEKLLALTSDPANAHAPGLEEMQHWVEAKLQGRLIREMLGTPPKG
jgi:hypothetical protein